AAGKGVEITAASFGACLKMSGGRFRQSRQSGRVGRGEREESEWLPRGFGGGAGESRLLGRNRWGCLEDQVGIGAAETEAADPRSAEGHLRPGGRAAGDTQGQPVPVDARIGVLLVQHWRQVALLQGKYQADQAGDAGCGFE